MMPPTEGFSSPHYLLFLLIKLCPPCCLQCSLSSFLTISWMLLVSSWNHHSGFHFAFLFLISLLTGLRMWDFGWNSLYMGFMSWYLWHLSPLLANLQGIWWLAGVGIGSRLTEVASLSFPSLVPHTHTHIYFVSNFSMEWLCRAWWQELWLCIYPTHWQINETECSSCGQ